MKFRNLCIDIGNTRTKIAVFIGHDLVSVEIFQNTEQEKILAFVDQSAFEKCILSSVAADNALLEIHIKAKAQLIQLSSELHFPIKLNYHPSQNLGKDRIAAAVGAFTLYHDKTSLIVNLGSCVTYDLLDGNQFLGGNIAPGMNMRWRAMHEYTAGLPLSSETQLGPSLLGQSTLEALANGVIQGLEAEIRHYYKLLLSKYSALNCVLTGGDANVLVKRLNFQTFVEPYLVLKGLNYILLNS